MEDYWCSNKNRTRNKIHPPCCLLLVLNLSGCLSIYVSIYLSILGQEVLHLVSLQESHSIPCRRLCLQCGDTLCSSFFFFYPLFIMLRTEVLSSRMAHLPKGTPFESIMVIASLLSGCHFHLQSVTCEDVGSFVFEKELPPGSGMLVL